MATRRVVYARINRRTADQAAFAERPFHQEMLTLADRGHFHASYTDREWFATDLEVDSSETFMTGIVGYESRERYRHLDEEAPSWKKAATSLVEGASPLTLTPFGVDLRDDERWIAFAPTHRIKPMTFALGFKVLLETAATDLGLMPAEWDVNLIPSKKRVIEWITENPDVKEFTRVVTRPNPGRVIDADLEKLERLGGKSEYEKIVPYRNKTLNLAENLDFVQQLLEGSEKGNVEVTIKTRSGRSTFRSKNEIEEGRVEDWGDDWDLATDRMLEAVRQWSEGVEHQTKIGLEDDS